MHYTNFSTKLGSIVLLSNGSELTGLYFENQKYLPTLNKNWMFTPELEIFKETETQLLQFLEGKIKHFTVELSVEQGTDFQRQVWAELSKIKYGHTISYSDIAKKINQPFATRAVAVAISKNPISIIIPCHRVIGSGGALIGYAAGIQKKDTLLNLERKTLKGL